MTVKAIASDLAAAFKAIDLCKPGDVVVIDSHGSANTASRARVSTIGGLKRIFDCKNGLGFQSSVSKRMNSGRWRSPFLSITQAVIPDESDIERRGMAATVTRTVTG